MNDLLAKELDFEESLVGAIEGVESERERFKITDLESANWAFKKLRAIENNIKEIEDLVKAEVEPYELEISRLNKWKEDTIRSYDNSINFFNSLLEEYYRGQREADNKFKLNTPYGKVISRKQQPKWDYDDELIIESIKSSGITYLITKEIIEKVDKNNLKSKAEILENAVSKDGVIAPSIVKHGDVLFLDVDTGEVIDTGGYTYHSKVVVVDGKIIEGVTITEREDSITIKVEV